MIATMALSIVFLFIAFRLWNLQVTRHNDLLRLARLQALRWNTPLEFQASRLEDLQNNIEKLSFGEIKDIVEDTRKYLAALRIERDENLYTVNQLRREIYEQDRSLQALKTDAERIKALKEADIDTLTYLLTRDAKNENTKSFLLGIVVSFPLGVISSLLASYLFHWQTRARSQISTSTTPNVADQSSA